MFSFRNTFWTYLNSFWSQIFLICIFIDLSYVTEKWIIQTFYKQWYSYQNDFTQKENPKIFASLFLQILYNHSDYLIYSLSSFVLGGIQTIFNHPWCVSYINNSYKIFVIIISSLKYKQKQLSMEQILEFSFYRFSFLQKRCIFMNSCCRYVHSCIREA